MYPENTTVDCRTTGPSDPVACKAPRSTVVFLIWYLKTVPLWHMISDHIYIHIYIYTQTCLFKMPHQPVIPLSPDSRGEAQDSRGGRDPRCGAIEKWAASLVGLLGQGPHYFGISLDQGIQTFLVFWTGFLTIGCDQGSTLEDTAANHFVIGSGATWSIWPCSPGTISKAPGALTWSLWPSNERSFRWWFKLCALGVGELSAWIWSISGQCGDLDK